MQIKGFTAETLPGQKVPRTRRRRERRAKDNRTRIKTDKKEKEPRTRRKKLWTQIYMDIHRLRNLKTEGLKV